MVQLPTAWSYSNKRGPDNGAVIGDENCGGQWQSPRPNKESHTCSPVYTPSPSDHHQFNI